MKTVAAGVLGAVIGLLAGLVLSEVIGIVGVLVFHTRLGIKYLPLILAVPFAVLAMTRARRMRRETG